jgi:hypothetical protein
MVNISVELAQAMLQVIDYSASKGVFIGDKLSIAGSVRADIQKAIAAANAPDEKYEYTTKPSEK